MVSAVGAISGLGAGRTSGFLIAGSGSCADGEGFCGLGAGFCPGAEGFVSGGGGGFCGVTCCVCPELSCWPGPAGEGLCTARAICGWGVPHATCTQADRANTASEDIRKHLILRFPTRPKTQPSRDLRPPITGETSKDTLWKALTEQEMLVVRFCEQEWARKAGSNYALEQRTLSPRWRDAKVFVSQLRRHTSPGGAVEEPDLHQERFVDLLNRIRLFGQHRR